MLADKTSRLILTTRNKIVAKYDQCVHKMKLLDPEKSLELFLKKAFIGRKCPKELVSIGEQILEKCDGLPLAISVVGGLLVDTQSKRRWEEVLNQINSYLDRPENNVPKILELSYQNLSPQLKSCFLCLAFFKEDSTISARRLVDIWFGLGLIQQEGRATIDGIGRGHLNELINRSMLQVDDFINDDRVKNCRLHDLVREVCLRKAKEEIGLKVVKGEEGITSESSWYKPRHRVVYGKNFESFSSSRNIYLRSLFLLNVSCDDIYVSTPSRSWRSFQLLKILDLDGFGFRRLPNSFRHLLGLKCLRIRGDRNFLGTFVLQLPRWFDHLKKLEVVDMEKVIVMFPSVALKMERLRHLRAHLIYSIHLSIDNWKSIETLNSITLADWMECSSRLIVNCHLRKLGMYLEGTERNNELRRVRASLEKMTDLVELRLKFDKWLPKWGAAYSMEKIIPNLNSLSVLKLSGGMRNGHCPVASAFPPNLTHLTLANLDADPMEELGKLPKLHYLKLSNFKAPYVGYEMNVLHDGFPCLKALSLKDVDDLIRIDIEEGGMPCLKQLQIHHCPCFQTHNLPKHIIISAA